VPVIVGALNNIPLSFATLGARQENAGLLQRAGATVVLNGGADGFNARNVRFEAGVATIMMAHVLYTDLDEDLPAGAFDLRVHVIVTPDETIRCDP